jgi:hypothetical protein
VPPPGRLACYTGPNRIPILAPPNTILPRPSRCQTQEGGSGGSPPNVGDLLAVVSAVLFAMQITAAEAQMHRLPKRSELPLMAVSMLTVAGLTSAAAAAAHAGDLPAAAAGVRELFNDWGAAATAALGGGGGGAPAGESAEALRTLQQLLWTSVVTTDAVLFAELIALQASLPGGCRNAGRPAWKCPALDPLNLADWRAGITAPCALFTRAAERSGSHPARGPKAAPAGPPRAQPRPLLGPGRPLLTPPPPARARPAPGRVLH